VLAAVDLAAEHGALEEDVFQAEAEAFLGDVRGQGQFQLRLFDPERPFQRGLHAQSAFDPCAADAAVETHGCNPSRKSICAGSWAASVGRQIHWPEAMGSCERAPRM
jgi:hypothetical protein